MNAQLEYRGHYGKFTGEWYDTKESAMKYLYADPELIELDFINPDKVVIETRIVDEVEPETIEKDEFLQPVAMICTEEEYERDLRIPLLKMGYKEKCIGDWKSCPLLVTNYMKEAGLLGNLPASNAENHKRLLVDGYDPERFLYLASIKGTGTKATVNKLLKEGNIISMITV